MSKERRKTYDKKVIRQYSQLIFFTRLPLYSAPSDILESDFIALRRRFLVFCVNYDGCKLFARGPGHNSFLRSPIDSYPYSLSRSIELLESCVSLKREKLAGCGRIVVLSLGCSTPFFCSGCFTFVCMIELPSSSTSSIYKRDFSLAFGEMTKSWICFFYGYCTGSSAEEG